MLQNSGPAGPTSDSKPVLTIEKYIAPGLSLLGEKSRLASIEANAMLCPGGLMRFLEQL